MDVRLPNGKVIKNVPEGTNKWTIAEKALSAGLATPEDFGQQSANPTESRPGTGDNFLAGVGKGFVDLGRGIGQAVGLVSREDVAKARELDRPLAQTRGGFWGNVAGAAAPAVLTAAIPGANTVTGAGLIGAGLGYLQPSTSTRETLTNTGVGGAAGAGSVLAARGLASLYRGGKAMVDPFFKGGQQRIASRALTEMAGGPEQAQAALANMADNAADVLPGVNPTTAELAQNPGLSQLDRTMRNNPQFNPAFTNRTTANRQAVLSVLDSVAGDSGKISAAQAARSSATEALYGAADDVLVTPDKALANLLSRPSVKKAWQIASELAGETGEAMPALDDVVSGNAQQLSGRSLHYLKLAMDDLADNPAVRGIGGNEARAITATKRSLVDWIGEQIPEYDAARKTYAAMSKPINQMEIGQALRDKLVPALTDMGGGTRLRPQAFAQAMRDGDLTAARVLDRSRASLADIMTPDQMQKLNQVGRELARQSAAQELGKATGSNTAQNIVSQNIIGELMKPLGASRGAVKGAAQSTIGQSILRPLQFPAKLGEERILEQLAEAALDPAVAQKMLERGIKPEVVTILKYQALLGPAAATAATQASKSN